MQRQSHECKHSPNAQYTGITRFYQFVSHRKTDKACFCCSSCGAFLRIPRLYTHAALKIGYLLFSILITMGIYEINHICGTASKFSIFLSVCFVFILMHYLQTGVSASILSFSIWEQAISEKDAQIQFELMKQHDSECSLLWKLGIAFAGGFITQLPWWILLIVLLAAICSVVYRGYQKSTARHLQDP